ncbi:hypothetical protein DSO57_1001684 [Entomophthora muscae]|uniref:Uncharacterized protein n=1 Tax=Entomophthora muscae TaxID=34485 RepID=A0ACC2TWL8_9FUNG|nr:hypothetical protein DSO57_1001684 [Entomophthora muscae]
MSPPIKKSLSSSYDYSKLGFAYVTLLGFTEQVISHMGAWQTWASSVNYMIKIAPVVYWVFQACPMTLFAENSDTTPGHGTYLKLPTLRDPSTQNPDPRGSFQGNMWIYVIAKISSWPANVYYDMQGALEEMSHGVSNA